MSDWYAIFGSNGRIRRVRAADSTTANDQVGAGEFILNQDLDPETQYIVGAGTTNTVTTRPDLGATVSWNKTAITADGSDSAVLSSLPNPSIINVSVPDGVGYIPETTITDGSLTFTANHPGLYEVIIDHFPHQLYRQTITAT